MGANLVVLMQNYHFRYFSSLSIHVAGGDHKVSNDK